MAKKFIYKEITVQYMNKPQNSEYDWEIKYVKTQRFPTVIVEGVFSINGHSKMIQNVVSQNFWKPGMNILIDDRRVEFSGTDVDLVKKVSENFRSFEKQLGNGKVAILMDSLTDYARGRQFELLTKYKMSTRLNIFMDEEKAWNWLKLS